MYPHERSLVQRLQNKSFALIGVNSDDTREAAKSAVTDEHLTWRSFFDGKGGRIAHQWQIIGFPTIYLIDHKGVIRHMHVGNPGDDILDGEIDQLVKEAETQESS
jgi:peroxiredoxin